MTLIFPLLISSRKRSIFQFVILDANKAYAFNFLLTIKYGSVAFRAPFNTDTLFDFPGKFIMAKLGFSLHFLVSIIFPGELVTFADQDCMVNSSTKAE